MESARYSCQILMKLQIFSADLKKKYPQISNFISIRPVSVKLFHGDGLKTHDATNSRISQFCERAQK
jgi:hypothetical protein